VLTIAYAPGVWDLLHVGHLVFLERARALGDRLIVGVPSDEVVEEGKGRPPIIPLADRLRMLQSLKCVDAAVPYYKLEFLAHLAAFKPDVLVVGETWGRSERHLAAEKWAASNACRVVVMPYTSAESTTAIKNRIRSL